LRRIHPIVEPRDGIAVGFDFEMTGSVEPDRTFETVELPPGAYFLRVPDPPEGWQVESVLLNGRDISDVPFDVSDRPIGSIVVRFTDHPATLAGTVQAASRDDRLDDAIVVAMPVDRTRWIDYGKTPRRLQRAVVSRDGGFSISGLPAGDYLVVAVHDDFVTDWRNPAFLETAAAVATRVSVTGTNQNVALRLQRIK